MLNPSFGGGSATEAGAAATLYRLQGAGAPVDGVTGANVVDVGEKYFDTVGKVEYLNVGTKAVPAYSGRIGA